MHAMGTVKGSYWDAKLGSKINEECQKAIKFYDSGFITVCDEAAAIIK